MNGIWLALYTLAVSMASGAAGALAMTLLIGGRKEDDWREFREWQHRQKVLGSLGRRS